MRDEALRGDIQRQIAEKQNYLNELVGGAWLGPRGPKLDSAGRQVCSDADQLLEKYRLGEAELKMLLAKLDFVVRHDL